MERLQRVIPMAVLSTMQAEVLFIALFSAAFEGSPPPPPILLQSDLVP